MNEMREAFRDVDIPHKKISSVVVNIESVFLYEQHTSVTNVSNLNFQTFFNQWRSRRGLHNIPSETLS